MNRPWPKYCKNKTKAERFIQFILSEKGKATFEKYHYFATKKQAFDYIGQEKKVGGYYRLPETWIK